MGNGNGVLKAYDAKGKLVSTLSNNGLQFCNDKGLTTTLIQDGKIIVYKDPVDYADILAGNTIEYLDEHDLYIRETPNGYVLGQINKGNRVEINGEKSGMWTKVKVANIGVGWAATKYLKVDGTENATATVITNKQDKTQKLFDGQVTAKPTLYVRTWAGKEYPTLKKIPYLKYGAPIEVMNYTQKAKDGTPWYYIRMKNKYYGFVSSKYIKKV